VAQTCKSVLPIIVISQFFCTSIWFAGNAILPVVLNHAGLGDSYLITLTSLGQFGFILGTLTFSVLSIPDRFSPSLVFFICSIAGSLLNLFVTLEPVNPDLLYALRLSNGFFLAGVYPIGMKIASDHSEKGLSKSLGLLVGALVLGTSFPYLLRSITLTVSWKYMAYLISLLSFLGGLLILLLVPDGPYRSKNEKPKLFSCFILFHNKSFRRAALGYFGHMWELYTFWAFVPMMILLNKNFYSNSLNGSLIAFVVIAAGAMGCAISGYWATFIGVRKVAIISLVCSLLCCLLSPFFIVQHSIVLVAFLVFWGIVVVADSPMFSTLVASQVPLQEKGIALTIVNGIGFAITIVSMESLQFLSAWIPSPYLYTVLAIGPLGGLIAMFMPKPVPEVQRI